MRQDATVNASIAFFVTVCDLLTNLLCACRRTHNPERHRAFNPNLERNRLGNRLTREALFVKCEASEFDNKMRFPVRQTHDAKYYRRAHDKRQTMSQQHIVKRL
jgi:hypothetical protein